MKNLIPLRYHISYWDKIVQAKHTAPRARLQALRASVLTRMKSYRNLCIPVTLETIAPSTYTGRDRTLLQGCYDKSMNLSKLKAKIKAKQPRLLQSECQYCNINEPLTFDHYLPQAKFSEFSAFSQNLVPCCYACNTSKSQTWLDVGRRTFIHYYFDDLPTTTYLECQIKYKKDVPIIKYKINPTSIPADMRDVIISHYTKLDLLERYKGLSDGVISDALNAILNPKAPKLSRQETIDQLLGEAEGMKTKRGPNYWRAVCIEALAHSKDFLDEAGF